MLARRFLLPEIFPGATFSGTEAMGFHFIDNLVHAWDVARSVDLESDPDTELAAPALALARTIPNGQERLAPGAAFAPGAVPANDAPPLHEVLVLLGRAPDWASESRPTKRRAK